MNNSTNGTAASYVKTCYVLDDEAEVIVKYPTEESVLVHVIALIIIIVLIFTTISLNGVTFLTIWRSQILRQKPSNFAIMLQSFIDLANGILVMPLTAYHWINESSGNPSCVTIYVLKKSAMLMFFYTLTTLSVMNFERYMGVLHPFMHRTLITNTQLLAYVVSICAIQTVIYTFSLTHREIIRPILITTTLLFILTTVFVYSKIFLKIRETGRVGVVSVDLNTLAKNVKSTQSKDLEKRSQKQSFLKEVKAAKSTVLVVFCSLVCCIPGALTFGPLNLKSSFKAIAIKMFCVILAMLNSTLNSVLHFWMNSMLRKLGKNMISSILDNWRE